MVDMVVLPSMVIATLVYGCQLGILSVAFSLNYITDEIPNFALGGIIGTGILINWTITREMGLNPYLGVPVAFLVGGLINSTVFLGIIDKSLKKGRSLVQITLITLGIEFIVSSLKRMWWYWIREHTQTWVLSLYLKKWDLELWGNPMVLYYSVAMAVFALSFIKFIFPRLNAGRVFLAFSENRDLAEVQGVNIKRVKAFTWFVSGGLAGVIGAIAPLFFHSSVSGTFFLVTAALAGCILGGIKNPVQSMLGGLLLGSAEIALTVAGQAILGVWFGEYRTMIPIFAISLVLYFAPDGLFNRLRLNR